MVSEKMGLPYYRRRGRGRRRGPVHNTNFLEKWLFSIIYFEKTINKRKVSIKEKFIFTSQSNYIFYIYIFTKYHEFLKCVQI